MSWVNKYAIMRDLSLAQGCVPVEVAGTVSGRQKPPMPNFIENTEEEFYRHWVGGDGDISAPDLGLIRHMLDVVRDYDAPPLQEEEAEKNIEISKPNESKTEFTSKDHGVGDNAGDTKKIRPKVRKQRNVAITSLLQNIKEMENKTETKIKLLKPTDFSGATEKVNSWLDKQKSHTPKKKTLTLSLDPSSMFKRREVPKSIVTAKQEQSLPPKTPSSPYVQISKYVPSKNAEEYYKKLVEASKMKEMIMENVWTKAEMQMREIDERRKQEAELFALSLAMAKSFSEATDTGSPAILAEIDVDNHSEYFRAMKSTDTGSLATSTETDIIDNHAECFRALKSTDAGSLATSAEIDVDNHSECFRAMKSTDTGSPATSAETDVDNHKLDIVRLPQHRHLLADPCIVCEVANKEKKTDINEYILNCSDTEKDTESPISQVVNEHIKSWRSSITDDMKEAQSWRAKPEPDEAQSWRAEPEPDEAQSWRAEPEPDEAQSWRAEPEPVEAQSWRAEPEPDEAQSWRAEPEPDEAQSWRAEPEPDEAESERTLLDFFDSLSDTDSN